MHEMRGRIEEERRMEEEDREGWRGEWGRVEDGGRSREEVWGREDTNKM